jgi:glycosyltransferase involved in cell wall biosynthesis
VTATALAEGRTEPRWMGATALVHDYMTQMGGAERVAGHLARQFSAARLFTTVHDAREVPLDFIGGRPWQTSFLQPLVQHTGLKPLLPLLPYAAASLDVSACDTVISSSSAFGHHVRKAPGALHVCYCCTPAHFLWLRGEYFRGRRYQDTLLAPLMDRLRRLDLRAAADIDAYIAVSEHAARRVAKVYGRQAQVVNPPVEVGRFCPSRERSGRFLVLSRLVRSKRVELVIEAANRYALPLDVIGKGTELSRLRGLAGPTVRLHGWQPDNVVRRALAESTAVVVAGEEDFGLVMAEAQASGRPPVAFASGGATEIIEDGVTGFLFAEQTPELVAAAMQRAADHELDRADLIASAARFDIAVFHERFQAALDVAAGSRCASTPASISVER